MINIAIDGFSAVGKSSLSKALAKRLNMNVLDTGAIYRGLACEYLNQNLGEPDDDKITAFVNNLKVEIFFENDVQHIVINGNDYTGQIRREEIGHFSSKISIYPILRDKVLSLQRKFAEGNDCIMEGRDIGSVVLPNAQVKLFVTASNEVRAERRYKELIERGQKPDMQEILRMIEERDYQDVHRETAPLIKTEDAVEVDTSNMTLEEVIAYCASIVHEKTGL